MKYEFEFKNINIGMLVKRNGILSVLSWLNDDPYIDKPIKAGMRKLYLSAINSDGLSLFVGKDFESVLYFLNQNNYEPK